MAPVQELTDLQNKYKTAFAPQQAILDQQIVQNDQSGVAQTAGLDAAKTSAFGDITQSASDRGGYFSGFAPDQEAKYTGSTYLPALAQLQSAIAQTRGTLLGKKADIDTQVNTQAIGEQNDQRTALQKWQADQEQAARAAAEAEKGRQFTASQASLDRQFTASQAAAKTAATPNVAAITNSVGAYLTSKMGKDQKVSPASFQEGRKQWVAAGGDPAAYAQAFYGFVNKSHQGDYF